ncbi:MULTISPECIES: alternative ribosome rescue aminoacyl-tRNA hydrolase ArfB [unclassified Vibrio]|uniref:Alternative ribosome rescue aminoacyl-tRNA hydrolase ArfB n=1 Tax=Vibrio sp. HB236076 TaxID=3232307 RepID=A0AB39HJR0_9VIBR|nr:alternative ribosome rescue aminoacyl-tRNA hydrolase ArfB [Vibrio sp. HB161653]MDP5253214.1 alternative ribosome rescue aminoacyl-tRNA hydrolase ArfB [Vibrio sp. HB161653]
MIAISSSLQLKDSDVEFHAVRSQGNGGQNVNKVNSAVHLRFDIKRSSLPDHYKSILQSLNDHRVTQDGVIVIKAQNSRSQQFNKEQAIARLVEMIQEAIRPVKARRATKPTRSSQRKRLDKKTQQGDKKRQRQKVNI